MQDTIDDLAEQAREIADETPRRVRGGIRNGFHVLVGAADMWSGSVRTLIRTLLDTPAQLGETVRRTPGRTREALEALRRRGEELVARIERRPDVREAEERFDSARRSVKGATTSTRRALKAGGEAVRDIAGAVGSGESWETPFEEYTYDELYQIAAEREIEGRSTMTKDELIAALRR